MLIDIHAHLTDERYGGQTENLVKGFLSDGVGLVVDSGYNVESSKNALINAKRFDRVYCTLGIHPGNPDEYDGDFEKFLIDNAVNEKVVAVGEIGLDYHYDGYDKNKQEEVFYKQMKLADGLGLPFVVHSRNASKDMCAFLKAHRNLINHGFLLHCYSESKEQAKNYLDMGAYFSFGGVITFKNSHRDEVVGSIPITRVFGETDAPYLTPEPNRGKTNFPGMVAYVYRKMAEIYGVDENCLQEQFAENARTLFKKIKI